MTLAVRGMLSAMVTKPKRRKRPADVVSNAVHVMRVLTGEVEEVQAAVPAEKNPAAVALGRMGGEARAKSMSKKARSAVAKSAAATRWGKK